MTAVDRVNLPGLPGLPAEPGPPGASGLPAAPGLPRSGPPATPEALAPASDAWSGVSPRLATVKRLTASIWLAMATLPAVLVPILVFHLWWVGALAGVAGFLLWLWLWLRAPRIVASWGWAQRDADLCVTHGLWWRELLVVPFGRMQMVKVSAGPLLQRFGLASVELITASPQTNAVIPGLPLEDARHLRDLLIELSDAEGSGL